LNRLKFWHPGQKKILIGTLPTGPLKKKRPWQNGQKKAKDQYPKLIFHLEDQYLFLLEDQYPKLIFSLEDQYPKLIFSLEDQYPKSISKRPR
jgi:hypothetical protein